MSDVESRLKLNLLGSEQIVPSEELDPESSPHTGQLLRRVRVSFRVPTADSDAVRDTFNKARQADNPLTSPDGSQWAVSSSSYSYSDGDNSHHHQVELREVEEIQAEQLQLLGLELIPTKYEEEAEDGGKLFISARVEPDAQISEKLEAEIVRDRDDLYFDVVRLGVNDTPIRMRFGRCLWQGADGARIHLIRLVSEAGDTDETQRGVTWFEPQLGHLLHKAVEAEAMMATLLEELETAGVLDAKSVDAVRASVKKAWQKRGRDFDEASKLDEYF